MHEIRSISRYGTSAVTVVFEDGVDPYFARHLVSERLPRAREATAAARATPEMGPMSTGLGEIYQFEVRGAGQLAHGAALDPGLAGRPAAADGARRRGGQHLWR